MYLLGLRMVLLGSQPVAALAASYYVASYPNGQEIMRNESRKVGPNVEKGKRSLQPVS